MKTELSALLDGEMQNQQAQALLSALKADENLRDTWCEYQLIGDALRGEPQLASDITARVMGELEEEPVVLAPPRQQGTWRGSVLALAASLAGVTVVGWLALSPAAPVPEPQTLARVERLTLPPEAERAMQGYLVAHQANLSELNLRGGTQNIRTVSMAGTGR